MRQGIAILSAVCFFLLFSSGMVTAQESDTLSKNSEDFFQQVSSILLNTPSKVNMEKSQALLDRLYSKWTIGRFNKAEKDAVKQMVAEMRQRKLKTYPYLYQYIHALTLLAESKQLPKSIVGWHVYAIKQLNGKRSHKFLDFAEFTIELFENERFYFKKSLSWYHRNSKFRFDPDTNFLLRFERLNLVVATKLDSSTILKTSGVFNYDKQLWTGENGTVKWIRFGEEYEDRIYAEFTDYQIDVTKSSYSVDSAVLHYERFFQNPVLGTFSEKIMASRPSAKTSYPRFDSYLDDFELQDIYPGITYFGGFYLNGLKLFGHAGDYDLAYITMDYNGEVIGRASAETFQLREDKVESVKTEVVFYLEGDSLFHPSLQMRYFADGKRLELFSAEEGADMVPFFDSYHQLDIYSPALFWSMDSTELFFRRIRGVHREDIASFVSSNYFSDRDFYEIQGMDEVNPIYVVQNYLKTYSDKEITVSSLAQFMKMAPEQVSAMLIKLSNNGFLVYNEREKKAIVKDRFYDFINAKAGLSDYDVLRMESRVTSQPNAKMNLTSLALDVYGVPEIYISDSQDVYIFPYDQSISFKKNRDFTFNGQVHMGLFDFYSRNNTFVYDSFMINLNYIDSLAFQVYSTDSLERIDSVIKVKNIISELNGTIYVDKPFNKSGLKQFEEYPIFVSDEASYVYFNEPFIQDSTLIPERFFYRIEPFMLDSVLSFSTKGMSFAGTLNSGGVFPPIYEPLVVMEDYSLGFAHKTPNDGYPIYGGKGTFTDSIFLTNDGFTGSGRLDYLSSSTVSEDYIFYLDSLKADAQQFKVRESPVEYNFPYAFADTVKLNWQVDTNVMYVENPIDTFQVYRDAALDGILALSPDHMNGDGSFFFEESEIQSSGFDFLHTELTADSADFFLRKDVDTLVFKSHGYFARIDFEQKRGMFDNLYEDSFVEFPYNKYISNLDEVEWEMDQDRIVLNSDIANNYKALDTLSDVDLIDYKLSGPEFISIDEDPDSIVRFFAGKATYDLNTFTIDVENVKMLKVADAAIFPSEEYLKIMRDGGIYSLFNARIIADTLNKNHYVYDAEVDIINRHWYYAKGYVDYVDRNGARQPIYFMRLETNVEGVTTGFGQLEPMEIFFLSPEYFFTGEISLKADVENLRFTGGYRINEDCIGQEDKWVAFDKYLDPNNIFFDINNNSVDLDQQPVRFGMAYSNDTRKFYPLILQSTDSPSDEVVIEAKGQIDFDTATISYRVGSGIIDLEGVRQDNYVALNTQRCILEGDGIFEFGLNLNRFKVMSAGDFRHLIIPDSTYLNTATLLDFYFDDGALNMMIDSLRLINSTVKNPGEGYFPMFLKKVLGYENSAKLITELSLYGQMQKVPKELEHAIIFSDLKLKWDEESRSFISKGPIGIGYIAGTPVNKYVDGYIQIEKGRSSSSLEMYLKLNNSQWYYFSFQHGILQVMSSDNAFNDYISLMKPAKRILNPESDTDYYEFVISTRRKVIDFVRKMEKIEKRL